MKNFIYHYTSLEVLYKLLDNIIITDEDLHNRLITRLNKLTPNDDDEFRDVARLIFENCRLKFHLSHITFMNDPTEFNLLLENIEILLDEYEEINYLENKSKQLCKSIRKRIEEYSSLFILSFSKLEDSLLMWRGYGEDGQGVCLGFDSDSLVTKECIYDLNKVKEGIGSELLKNIYDSFTTTLDVDYFKVNPLENIKTICSVVKHKAYEIEEEIRLIIDKSYQTGCTKYKKKGGIIIPYIEYEIPLLNLKKITIGPSANSTKTQISIRNMFYNMFGFWPHLFIDLELSTIPYISSMKF